MEEQTDREEDNKEREREIEKEKGRESERGHTQTYTQRLYAYMPWHTVEVKRQHWKSVHFSTFSRTPKD